jgi:D-alanyl-D-alanine carboxypeptidase
MRELIEANLGSASTKRTAPMIAESAPKAAPQEVQRPVAVAQAAPKATTKDTQRFSLAGNSTPARIEPATTSSLPAARPEAGSTEPIRPVMVKTLHFRAGAPTQTASAAPVQLPPTAVIAASPEPQAEPAPPVAAKAELPRPAAPPAVARADILGVLAARIAATEPAAGPAAPVAPAAPAAPAAAPPAAAESAAAPAKPTVRSGWLIQVGAYEAEDEAKQRLAAVKTKASRLLATAEPFTETILKGGTTYHRARFAGFDREKAEAACKYLKRNDVDCITVKN